jgi:hypothetical protein
VPIAATSAATAPSAAFLVVLMIISNYFLAVVLLSAYDAGRRKRDGLDADLHFRMVS